MRFLWLYLFLQTILSNIGSGSSYFGKYRLCNQWSCINRKLNFTDDLPPKIAYKDALRERLPHYWHDIVDNAVEQCYYTSIPKNQYTNTCPGQSLMHCVVQKFIELCPVSDSQTSDACARVNSLAGYNYMFSQSRYHNLTQNIPIERRPAAFLQSYFNTKCCNIPELFSDSLLSECGFKEFMHYYYHETQIKTFFSRTEPTTKQPSVSTADRIKAVSLSDISAEESKIQETQDPLDCCELNDFIRPEWRSECGFKVEWDTKNRLKIQKDTTEVITTTEKLPVNEYVLTFVPISCEKLHCVFGKLNITKAGVVDKEAFRKLLDNMVKLHPLFADAKDKVNTQCLLRPLLGYDGDCEIHKLLSCTFDILSENCPDEKRDDLCKLFTPDRALLCQVSSSKYRSGVRRKFCHIPELLNGYEMLDCGVTSIIRVRNEPYKISPPIKTNYIGSCTQLTQSTSCVLNKMGALNKYGFMDYFKMKDKIREYSNGLTSNLYEFYNSALQNTPFYDGQCSSPKKLLNVLDSMLMICPKPNRNTSEQCNKIFHDLQHLIPDNVNRWKLDQMMKDLQNIYLTVPTEKTVSLRQTSIRNYNIYDFGLLGSKNAPPVEIIDLKPTKKSLVLLPVYQREPKVPLAMNSLHNDGILRG